jgi:hypothetical protein
LKDRKKSHKSSSTNPTRKDYNLKVYRFIRENGGWDNWTFIQLEEFPCKNKQELVAREREIFDLLKPTLNTNSPTLNVEKIKKTMVKYRIEHKDELLVKQKQYYDEHKDELLVKQKQYNDDNKVEISANKKQYYDKNKDELLVKQKQYYDEHKDEIISKHKQKNKCVCGCEVSNGCLSRHMKSAKHLMAI